MTLFAGTCSGACIWHLFLSTATAITPSTTASSAVSRNVKSNVSPIARLRSLSSSSHLTLEDAVLLSTGEKKIGEDIVSEFYHVNFTLLGCFDVHGYDTFVSHL